MCKEFLSDQQFSRLEDATDGRFVIPSTELSDEERKLNDKIAGQLILDHRENWPK